MSGSVSDPLGRPPRFKPRPHRLGGLGLDERKYTAIGGDELIVTRAIRIGGGACAIRIDAIRAGEALITSDLPVKVRGIDAFHLTVAVKDLIARNGDRPLLIALDLNPILGEQIRPLERGLRALRPAGGVLILGISGSNS